jgi:hypothetical protein
MHRKHPPCPSPETFDNAHAANTGGDWTIRITDATPSSTKHFLVIQSPLGRIRYLEEYGVFSFVMIAMGGKMIAR